MNCKKIKVLVFSLIATVSLSGCSFIKYSEEIIQEDQTALNEVKQEYIDKLNEQYSSENYYATESLIFEEEFVETINKINECTSEADVIAIYEAACDSLDDIKTKQDYEDEAAEALRKYKEDCVSKILNYVEINDYREAEQNIILSKIDIYCALVNSALTTDDADEYVREYKTEVYSLLTDKEYYAQELALLKEETIDELHHLVNLSLYRENESELILSLLQEVTDYINKSVTKEDVNDLAKSYELQILEVKTDDELTAIELEESANSYVELLNKRLVDSGLPNSYFADAKLLIEEAEATLKEQTSFEAIKNVYISYLKLLFKDAAKDGEPTGIVAYRNASIEEIELSFDKDLYEDDVYAIGEEHIKDGVKELYELTSVDDIDLKTVEIIAYLDNLPKKDTRSAVEKFREDLKNLYGDNILKEPECGLETANDLYELGEIVDYYAFYQMSETEFLCDTIVVDLNFEFPSDPEEFFYYFPKLFHGCVEYDYRLSKQKIIITLKACEFGDKNQCHVTRDSTAYVEYKDAHTAKRTNDYDDFKYKDNENLLTGIWNSQQLWYALEEGYNVECVKGSMADLALEQAKKILRETVNDEMSIEEKVFNISTWLGTHLLRVTKWYHDFPSNDIVRRADSALFGLPCVCQGSDKAFVIMAAMEGISAAVMTNNNTNHSDCYFLASNGKHYINPIYFVFAGNLSDDVSYSFMAISTANIKMYPIVNKHKDMHLIESDGISELYDNLLFHGKNILVKSKDDIDAIIKELENNPGERTSILIPSIYSDLVDYLNSFDYVSKKETRKLTSAPTNMREFAVSI